LTEEDEIKFDDKMIDLIWKMIVFLNL
jgi:hypothetical protein